MTDDGSATGVKPGIIGGVMEGGGNGEVTSGRGKRGAIPGDGRKGSTMPETWWDRETRRKWSRSRSIQQIHIR